MKALAIIMCPPLFRYPEPPKDQPGCTLIKCPHCGIDAWISEKKRLIRDNADEYFLACYPCLEELAETNPDIFKNSLRVNI